MKICFILNPRSGHLRRRPGAADEIRRLIAARPLDATLVLTERAGHATELARAAVADGCACVVAVGGDGTMNEVARALVSTPTALGLVPCGSGNGLARHLGIPLNFSAALEQVLTGQPRLVDTGVAAGHAFFCAAGVGFEAHIAAKFNQLSRRGFVSYLTTSAAAYWNYNAERYEIESANERREIAALTLVVANCCQYGNNAFIAPDAQLDDGRVNLTAIRPFNLLTAPAMLWRLFRGTLRDSSPVLMLAGEKFTLHRQSAGLLHTDGEVHDAPATVEFRVRPQSLRVIAPAAKPSAR